MVAWETPPFSKYIVFDPRKFILVEELPLYFIRMADIANVFLKLRTVSMTLSNSVAIACITALLPFIKIKFYLITLLLLTFLFFLQDHPQHKPISKEDFCVFISSGVLNLKKTWNGFL
jgi:hypothetical protein